MNNKHKDEPFPGSNDFTLDEDLLDSKEEAQHTANMTDEQCEELARCLFGNDFVDGLKAFDAAKREPLRKVKPHPQHDEVNSLLSSQPHE